jgi:hypothetical protein
MYPVDIPPQCQDLANELSQLRVDLIGAQQDLANERDPDQKKYLGKKVNELRAKVSAKSAALDACRGCLDPLDGTWEDPFGFTSSITVMHPSVTPGVPSFASSHDDGELHRGLSFTFTGCDHEFISARPGWSMVFDPFPSFILRIRRLPPDVFTTTPTVPFIALTTTPYAITVLPVGEARVLSGSFERSSGHVNLYCSVSLGWLTLGGPPAYLNWLYDLNFDESKIETMFTTRTVPKTVAPTGSMLSGAALAPPSRAIRLVASGILSGGFAAGRPVEFVLSGTLEPALP